ncbi:MAG: hypothetical protein JW822_12265 [Spirochaetales bacterium]|nr:hypothetical protein [Spirochaetales bacterium]
MFIKKFHGIFSIIILSAALTTAVITIFSYSWIFALIYLAVIIISFMGISFFYCAKCCCRIKNCAHMLLGKLTLLMPERKEGPYACFDIIAIFLCVGLMLGFPQYWLFHTPLLGMIFWLAAGFAFLEIFLFVCTACENHACVLNKNKASSGSTK